MSMIDDCEQMAIDYNWTLARTNACHLSKTNSEMGELSLVQSQMQADLQQINWKVNLLMGSSTFIIMTIFAGIISLAIRKIFNGKKINK